jgi:hypothetical protein
MGVIENDRLSVVEETMLILPGSTPASSIRRSRIFGPETRT